jgi:aldehyde dehydrogenase (NAD+)
MRSQTEVFEVISPHTEQSIAQVAAAGPADVDTAVTAARAAFDSGPWGRSEPAERVAAIRRLADVYDRRRTEMADTITAEIGAPTTFAQRAQVGLPAMMMRAFCDLAERHRWQESRPGFFGADVQIRKVPVGVVAAIVPWNMPQFLIVAKLVPALLAGCTVVLKPAPESPLDALLLAEMLREVDLPDGVVSVLPGDAAVGGLLVSHAKVDKVSFTGSTAAGRIVAAACAANLTKVSLELGGKSAAIVLDDAHIVKTVAGLKMASLMNNGQACVAQTRILISERRHDEFVEALAEMMSGLVIGDPSDPATDIGPLVSRRQQRSVQEYIRSGVAEGAKMVLGGDDSPMDRGWYVRPTLFADATNDMTIAREEIFGPVLTVIKYTDERDAIRIANDSPYGLAGSVWTKDVAHGLEISGQIRTGTYGINMYMLDISSPFGGFKHSGIGREFAEEGLAEYCELQSVVSAGTLPALAGD